MVQDLLQVQWCWMRRRRKRILYISQPSLSATIKKIEARLGTPVFDRSTSPIMLTECGEKYIHYAEHLMDMENEFENYLNDFEALRTGHLSVGGSNLFASYVLPPAVWTRPP